MKLNQPDAGDTQFADLEPLAASPGAPEVPLYLFAFPDFGLLDVELPAGFVDQSWFKDTCPSFGLPDPDPNAEWPQLTVYIDYADKEMRQEPGGHRFYVYAAGSMDEAACASDDWGVATAYIAAHRKPA